MFRAWEGAFYIFRKVKRPTLLLPSSSWTQVHTVLKQCMSNSREKHCSLRIVNCITFITFLLSRSMVERFMFYFQRENNWIQAGAELYQAPVKLGLAKPSLPSKKLSFATIFKKLSLAPSFKTMMSSFIYQILRLSSAFQNKEFAFHFPNLMLSSI